MTRIYTPSPTQQALATFALLEARGTTYHVLTQAWTLNGSFEVGLFREAARKVVERQAALRTTFSIDESRILHAHLHEPNYRSIEFLEAADVAQKLHEPFDLRIELPIRFGIAKHSARCWTVAWSLHHVCYDAWSVQLIAQQLTTGYQGFFESDATDEIFLARDHEREDRANADIASTIRPYRSAGGEIATPEPVLLQPRTDPPLRTDWTADASTILRQAAGALRLSSYMLFLLVFARAMWTVRGERELIIGTPLSLRRDPALAQVVGPFFESAFIRLADCGPLSIEDAAPLVKRATLEALRKQGAGAAYSRSLDALRAGYQYRVALHRVDGTMPVFGTCETTNEQRLEDSYDRRTLTVEVIERPTGYSMELSGRSDMIEREVVAQIYAEMMKDISLLVSARGF